jgi:hypothetical protein
VSPDDIDVRDADDDHLLADLSVGPLVQASDEDVDLEDDESTMFASAATTAGISLTAEEAAVHVVEEP